MVGDVDMAPVGVLFVPLVPTNSLPALWCEPGLEGMFRDPGDDGAFEFPNEKAGSSGVRRDLSISVLPTRCPISMAEIGRLPVALENDEGAEAGFAGKTNEGRGRGPLFARVACTSGRTGDDCAILVSLLPSKLLFELIEMLSAMVAMVPKPHGGRS